MSFRYLCGHTVERNIVPHRTMVLHEYNNEVKEYTSIHLTDLLSDLTIHMLFIKVVTYT